MYATNILPEQPASQSRSMATAISHLRPSASSHDQSENPSSVRRRLAQTASRFHQGIGKALTYHPSLFVCGNTSYFPCCGSCLLCLSHCYLLLQDSTSHPCSPQFKTFASISARLRSSQPWLERISAGHGVIPHEPTRN